jgi:outer membrane protein assembly factor BamB
VNRKHIVGVVAVVTVAIAAAGCGRRPAEQSSPAQAVTKKWEFSAGRAFIGSPALGADGTIYAGSEDGFLYALDPLGNLKWKFYAGPIYTPPVVGSDGAIYITNAQGRLYAINRTGTERWRAERSGGRMDSESIGSAIDEDWVYTGCHGRVCATELSNGTLGWYSSEYISQYTAPLLLPEGGLVYPGRGRLNAVNRDGSPGWQIPPLTAEMIEKNGGYPPPGSGRFATPLALGFDGTIYVGTGDGHLMAVRQGGEVKWDFKTRGAIRGGAAIASDGTVYVGSTDERLYALRPDGTKKWELKVRGVIETAPALAADGTIFLAHNGQALAVSPEGKLLWEISFVSDCVASPTLAPDGTLYVATRVGKLFAVEGSGGGLMPSAWPKYQHDARNTGRAAPLI